MVQTRSTNANAKTHQSKPTSETSSVIATYDKHNPGLWVRTALAKVRTTGELRILTHILEEAADPTKDTFDAVDTESPFSVAQLIALTADPDDTKEKAIAVLTEAATVQALISGETVPTIDIDEPQFELITHAADVTLYAHLLVALQSAHSVQDVVAEIQPGRGAQLFIVIINVLTYNRESAGDDLLDRLNRAYLNNQGNPHSLANHQKYFKQCLANHNAFTPVANQITGQQAVARYCKQLTKLKAKQVTAAIKADPKASKSLLIAYRKAEFEAKDYGLTWNTPKREAGAAQANKASATKGANRSTPAPIPPPATAPPATAAAAAAAATSNPALRCTKCCKNGHTADQCVGNVVCYNCGDEGHLSRDCPKPQTESTKKYHERKNAPGSGTAKAGFCNHQLETKEHTVAGFF